METKVVNLYKDKYVYKTKEDMIEQVKDNVSWDMYFKSHEQVIKDYKIGKISFIELEKYIEELMEEYYIVRSEYFERFGTSED